MKKGTFTLNVNLLSRLLLTFVLMFSGGNLWADDDIVIINGNTISDGWVNGAGNSSYLYTIGTEELTSRSDTYSRLRSSSNLTFSNKRIIINAKRINDNESYVILYSGYTATIKFGYNSSLAGSGNEIYSSDGYIELISNTFSISNAQLDLRAKNVQICSAKIVDGGELQINENKPTALMKGSKSESVYVKYTPQMGWNTICVPFQLKMATQFNHLPTLFGDSYSVYSLKDYNNGTLSFSNALPADNSGLTANTPYLVYTTTPQSCHENGFELTSNVTIAYPGVSKSPAVEKSSATFQGTYVTKTYNAETDEDAPWYGVTQSGKIVKAGTNAFVKGYRAYFTGVSAPSTGVKMFIIEDEGTTDLGFVKMVDAEAKDVYTLTGQKVQKGRKGIYIVNGKKVVIK